ncbi:hypothetical protein BOTBODRAFT_173936 [Botryobasidium botryosum FD-172 SS1]|uniref:F-box domain-containing protein n=1 Tax=Botryobasidium botryosum (strain FD-172 SS1) TaxID=930990 RepID=A0A067MV79_BOTB1|nr:hypothetical protein BOTBODRAFT_173936 [Botryobasidium botryosum FD-172 SS1]
MLRHKSKVVAELRHQLGVLLAAARAISVALDDISAHDPPICISPPTHPSPQETCLVNAVSQLIHMRASILPESGMLTALLTDIHEGCNHIAPVNRLPGEILSYIFVLIQSPRIWPDTQVRQAIVLSSICRRWRETATSTGTLWDMFVLRGQSSYRIGELCAARSGERDLKVAIDFGKEHGHGRSKEVEIAGHRWRDLTLISNSHLSASAPAISDMDGYLHEIMHHIQPPASHPPTNAYMGLTCLSLKDMTNCYITVVQLDSVLRVFSQLRVLRLHDTRLSAHLAHPEVVNTPLALMHLEELSMVQTCVILRSYIFVSLVAPRLQSFEDGCISDSDSGIGPFFARTTSIVRLRLSSRPSRRL